MLRLLALPFALFLLVLSVGLVAAGLGLVADGSDGSDRGDGGRIDAPLVSIVGNGEGDSQSNDEGATVAGVSLIGFGILGAIAAVVLLIVSLSSRRQPDAPSQQQQQQVVVVTDGDARVDTGPVR